MPAKKKAIVPEPKPKRCLIITRLKDQNNDEALSKTLLKPEVTAALCLQTWEELHTVDGLRVALTEQIDAVHNGSMTRPESMLLAQAHTLDALFNSLAHKAHGQTHMPHYDSFLRLAFKAQSQCRSTLETLAAIKNPPAVYARQANINNGHQQINNGFSAPRTQENKNIPNELLEHTHGERLDGREKSEAIPVNTELEAVGEGCRSDNSRG